MTDEQLAEVRSYFERTYDGNKVIPIIDELLSVRSKTCAICGHHALEHDIGDCNLADCYCDRINQSQS